MTQIRLFPRFARSEHPAIQSHPINAPNTDKTTMKSSKPFHPDRVPIVEPNRTGLNHAEQI
jgi:hypothetical protein